MLNAIFCSSPRARLRRIGMSGINAIAKTGTVMKKPYQPAPGSSPRGCGAQDAMPTATMPAYTAPVIHQSRYNPEERANSLNPKIESNVTPIMTGTRPAKTTSNPIDAITSHERYVFQIEPSSFLNPHWRKPRTAPPRPSETGTIRRYARNTGSCSAVCGDIIAPHLEAQSGFVSSERLLFPNSPRLSPDKSNRE